MNEKFRYLSKRDREEIERLYNRGATVAAIADKIGAHTTTIYRAEIAQRTFEEFRRLELKSVKCIINYPAYKGIRTSMWNLILPNLTPPPGVVRYCCSILKECGGLILTIWRD